MPAGGALPRANRALVGLGCDRRKRRSGDPDRLTVNRDIACPDNSRLGQEVKAAAPPCEGSSRGGQWWWCRLCPPPP